MNMMGTTELADVADQLNIQCGPNKHKRELSVN